MNSIVPRFRFRELSSALSLAFAVSALAPGYAHSAAARGAPAAESPAARETALSQADLPPPPPSPAMEEKFRKLQKEMANDAPAAASPASKPAENGSGESVSAGKVGMQILFALAFVLVLAVVCIRLLKRMQGRLLAKPGKGGDIFEVLETCHLGSHQRVVAMRMNGEVGVLGVTQHGISLLTVLKEPAEELRRERESNSAAFSDNLNKLLERFKKPKRVSDMLDEGAA